MRMIGIVGLLVVMASAAGTTPGWATPEFNELTCDQAGTQLREREQRNPQEFRALVESVLQRAKAGQAEAQCIAGLMYEKGRGVLQDDREAVRWHRLAAEQGNAWAQASLGFMYETGRGVPQDWTLAYAWYTLAAARGDEDARNWRDRLAAKLTPAQLAEGQRLARLWKPGMGELPAPQEAAAPSERVVSTGTAFAVERDRLLTAAHVVRSCRSIRLMQEGRTRSATVQALDPQNDLALLRVAEGGTVWAAFCGDPPVAVGEPVVAAGFPLSGLLAAGLHVTTGIVSATAGLGNDARFWQITAPVQPGNSGGPLVDHYGAVIGVVVSKLDALAVAKQVGDIPQNVNFAVKGKVVEAFLEAQGLAIKRSSAHKALDVPAVADLVRQMSYFVECLN